jgi:hypothetical protein
MCTIITKVSAASVFRVYSNQRNQAATDVSGPPFPTLLPAVFTKLHGDTSQKTVILKFTAVQTSAIVQYKMFSRRAVVK